MIVVVMLLLSVLLPPIHLAITKGPWTRRNVLRLLLVYAFVFDVGAVGFLFGFIPHVFFADQAAELIGWPKGSMFQFEVGLHDGAWGILGFLCVFFGGGFWLATAIGWSFFMLGAASVRNGRFHRYVRNRRGCRAADTRAAARCGAHACLVRSLCVSSQSQARIRGDGRCLYPE